jgi:hypothetical protein
MPAVEIGRIVWATVHDPQGRNAKSRPLVVVGTTAASVDVIALDCVGVTSQGDQSPTEMQVALPWMRQGHPRTRLTRASFAVCNWSARILPEAVERVGGVVPKTVMNQIMEILERLRQAESVAAPTPSD